MTFSESFTLGCGMPSEGYNALSPLIASTLHRLFLQLRTFTVWLFLFAATSASAKLLMWFPFEEGSGSTLTDSSVNGNNLVSDGSAFQWNQKAGAPFGGSIYFDGNESAVAVKTETEIASKTIDYLRTVTSQKVTIAFWANPDASTQDPPPFGFSRSNLTRLFQMHLLQGNSAYFDVGYPNSGSSYYRAGGVSSSPVGVWTHWALVYDGTLTTDAVKIYQNGTQVFASGSIGAGGTPDWAQIALVDIGASQRYTGHWKGGMDDFGMWDEALTPAQIASLRSGGVASITLPVINSFKATPGNIGAGGSSTLSWSTRLGSTLSISPSVGTVSGPDGSVVVSPASTTTYRLTLSNGTQTSTRDVVVGVNAPESPLKISEYLADNNSGVVDEDGAHSDWVEIYNPNAFAVTLNGWKLSDSGATWAFPDMQIEGGQYLVVFASDKNRRDPAANLHTNFKLSADGDSLTLKRPDGSVSSLITFGAQRPDISGGLDAGGNNVYFPTPTPGSANGVSVTGFVDDPTFSVPRGFYSTSQSVSISSPTVGATIRYTTDKSTPTESNGTVYTGPIAVSATTVIRARAFKTNYLASNSVTETYLYLTDVLNQVFASGTAPGGWPVSGDATLNGQVMRYGFNSTLKAQYTTQQLMDGLRQIPTISIVTDQSNLTGQSGGIYSNASQEGIAWEKPASAEYINADGTSGFQINCGLRIRGGASRGDNYPKHAFRLFFRQSYGKGSLVFPINGTSGTSEFESIDIRTEENYHYANDTGASNTAVHEVFCRDLQALVGKPTTRSRPVHLYVNGLYWGLYQTEERAQQDYGATYFGGDHDDYDVVETAGASNHYYYEVSNGTVDAWRQTWNLSRACAANPTNENYFKLMGRNASGVPDPALPVYLDADSLAGTILLYYYTGDGDAILSGFVNGGAGANNWRGMRSRVANQPWTFFLHDCEHTVRRTSWKDQRVGQYVSTLGSANRSDFNYSNPEWIFEDLALNAEFRLKIADVAQRYFLNNGPLTDAASAAAATNSLSQPSADFNTRADAINQAIIPDIARWGQNTNQTYAAWQSQLTGIRTNFLQSRAASIITQLKARNFYPSVSPPTFSQRGGRVAAGFQLTLTAPGQTGTIYFTTDGSDPRAVGGAVTGQTYAGAIAINGVTNIRTRFLSSSGEWSALDEVTFSVAPPAAAGNLVVSKLDYHPVDATTSESAAGYDGKDFEYLELLNISGDNVDLRGVQITTGVTFSFAGSAITTLAPGARVLVVSNPTAFALRHGSGLPIAGTYSGNLSNNGELVQITGTGGQIAQFTYGVSSPWPTEANGNGAALVLKKPFTNPDPNVAGNWRASTQPGGDPGVDDPTPTQAWRTANFSTADLADSSKEATVWGDGADPDGDGVSNLLEFALHTDPNSSSAAQQPVGAIVGGQMTLTYSRSKAALAVLTFGVQSADTLSGSWANAGVTEQILSDDGTTQQVRASVPAGGSQKFLRLRVDRQ